MQNLNFIFFCIGLSFISIRHTLGQSPDKLTVEECISMGLEHNIRLRVARADVKEATAEFDQAKADRLPMIQGQASYMRLSGNIPNVDFTVPGMDTTFTLLPIELNRFYSELSISQPIYSGGRLNRQIEAAAHLADAAKFMEQKAHADLAFLVRQAYWNLYRATFEQEAMDASLESVEEHLLEVRNRTEEGMLLRTDLLGAAARHSEILLEQVETRNNLQMAMFELNRLIGLPFDSMVELAKPVEHVKEPINKDALKSHALSGQPELKAVSEQVKAQDAEVHASKGGRLPEINLVGRYIYARPNQYFFVEQDQFRGTWEAGLSMRWNIWSGGKRIGETEKVLARLEGAEANLADLKEKISMQVERVYLELERSVESIEVSAAHLESAEEAFLVASSQFDEGLALSTQVLDAEYTLRAAKSRYAGAVADYEIAQAAILNIMGKIWDDGI